MNIFQRIAAMCGREYVFIVATSGERQMVRARSIGCGFYARTYALLPYTETLLLPGGVAKGPLYVRWWEPITRKSRELYYEAELERRAKGGTNHD